jgi:chromosome partitioning protein
VCFIDCPPHNAPSINVAVELADFALIVTEPAAESIEQIASVVAIAKGLKRPTGILINKAPPKSNALTLTRSALTAFDVSVCQTALTSLLVYPYSAAEGTSPQEREPKGKAAREIAEVWQWAKQLSGLMQDGRESLETVDDDKQRMRKRG